MLIEDVIKDSLLFKFLRVLFLQQIMFYFFDKGNCTEVFPVIRDITPDRKTIVFQC